MPSECDKMAEARSEGSQTIGAFLDWLQHEQEITLCTMDDHGNFYPDRRTIEQLLADYFEVDLNAVERERRQILANLRKQHKEDRKLENQQALGAAIRDGSVELKVQEAP